MLNSQVTIPNPNVVKEQFLDSKRFRWRFPIKMTFNDDPQIKDAHVWSDSQCRDAHMTTPCFDRLKDVSRCKDAQRPVWLWKLVVFWSINIYRRTLCTVRPLYSATPLVQNPKFGTKFNPFVYSMTPLFANINIDQSQNKSSWICFIPQNIILSAIKTVADACLRETLGDFATKSKYTRFYRIKAKSKLFISLKIILFWVKNINEDLLCIL